MSETRESEQIETRTRRARLRTARLRNVALATVGAVLVVSLLAAGWLWVARGAVARDARTASSGAAAAVPGGDGAKAAPAAPGEAEVPNLIGMGATEAAAVLETAGFVVRVSSEGTPAVASRRRVRSQQPSARTLAAPHTVVTIVVPPKKGSAERRAGATGRFGGAGLVIVIDPGHQSHTAARAEALGPGSTQYKPAMSAGGAGASTGVPECEIALELANNVRKRLEAAGVNVVMTRMTNDVDISNAKRAGIANAAHATLFLRLHADTDADPAVTGVSTMYPVPTGWTAAISGASKRAAALIEKDAVAATGTVDRGAAPRSDMVGFNWSRVPSVQVQAGYPSNAVEDRLLASPNYQDKLAGGISDGVLAYLGSAGQ